MKLGFQSMQGLLLSFHYCSKTLFLIFIFFFCCCLKLIKFYLWTYEIKATKCIALQMERTIADFDGKWWFFVVVVAAAKCRFFNSVARCVQCQTGRRKRSATRHVWKMHRIFSLAACMLNIRCVANIAFKCVSHNQYVCYRLRALNAGKPVRLYVCCMLMCIRAIGSI